MASPMQKVSSLVSSRLGDTLHNIQNWGGVFYNAQAYGIYPDGTDVTNKLQALVNLANSEGRRAIFFPQGDYTVTYINNDERIVYFGDSARFVGGYNRVINQVGFSPTASGVVNVQDFGARGDGVQDDTQYIKDCIEAVISAGGGTILFPATGEFYKITSGITVTLPDGVGLTLRGEGTPELRLTTNVTADMIHINSTTTDPNNNVVTIEGIKFNGIGVPEQWAQTNYANLTVVRALTIRVCHVTIDNCRFMNLYGYGLRVYNYKTAYTNNLSFERVGGHWYANDTYDAFGDACYFAEAQDIYSVVTASNMRIVGYPADRPRFSRIAIALEYDAGNAFIENIYAEGYDRTIHAELCPDLKMFVNNFTFNRYSVGFYLHSGLKSAIISNGVFQNNSGVYSGTSGPIGTISMDVQPEFIQMNDCVFEMTSDCESFIDAPTYFNSCEFKSALGRWTIKDTNIQNMTDCELIGKCLYFFNSRVEKINNCKFLGQSGMGQTATLKFDGTDSYAIKFSNCYMENAFISFSNAPAYMNEFNSCRFMKDGSLTIVDENNNPATSFILAFNSRIIIRDCIIDVNASFLIFVGDSGTVLVGDNNKIVAGVWSSYP